METIARTSAHVAEGFTRTEANEALPEGLKTGCVSSMKLVWDDEHVPPAARLQPMTWESIAYLPLEESGIFGMVVVPDM